MFSEIEKSYQKNLQEFRFWHYYRWRAIALIIIAFVVTIITGWNSWIVAPVMGILLILLMFWFYWRDISRLFPDSKLSLREKRKLFASEEAKLRRQRLVHTLRSEHINTPEKIRLTLEYYERRLPSRRLRSLAETVPTLALTLASIFVIAYDDNLGRIDWPKLVTVMWPVLEIIAVVVIVYAFIKFYIARHNSRTATETALIEDLARIYVNFDQYRAELQA